MKKLHLTLDELLVESFPTLDHAFSQGTFLAFEKSPVLSCEGGCGPTEDPRNLECKQSAPHTCNPVVVSCGGSCDHTCDPRNLECRPSAPHTCNPIVLSCGGSCDHTCDKKHNLDCM